MRQRLGLLFYFLLLLLWPAADGAAQRPELAIQTGHTEDLFAVADAEEFGGDAAGKLSPTGK